MAGEDTLGDDAVPAIEVLWTFAKIDLNAIFNFKHNFMFDLGRDCCCSW